MHRWTIFCQRGNEISRYAGKRGRVDIQNAHNAVFVQTRQGDAEHIQSVKDAYDDAQYNPKRITICFH